MALYVEEFLYRGRPEGSKQPVSWHAVVGETITNGVGQESIILHGPMGPATSEAMGFPLETIVAEMNTVAMQERDAALVDKAKAEAERDAAIVEAEQATVAKQAAETERDAAVAEAAKGGS